MLNFPVEKALQAASAKALICAATGNKNNSSIDFPAKSRFVMACGASDQNDNRQSPSSPISWGPDLPGSNYGAEMSVVAPGVRIPTTDIVGSGGYNSSGDSMLDFQGTSAATPHVSGLAGLIFSIYPDISPAEARNTIERTADKVGTVPYAIDPRYPNGKWNKEMGYGRINALRAVLAAAPLNPDLPWFREVVFEGTMNLNDEENFGADETKTSQFFESRIPAIYQLGPFQQTHVELLPWINDVGGEVRGEVRFILDWKTDSSVDVSYNIKLYEGTSADTDDLDGEDDGKLNIPKDTIGSFTKKVTNTDEDDNDFIEIIMKIYNNRRP